MNFFNPKFPEAQRPPMPTGGMFKTGELVWDDDGGSYSLPLAAALCFLMHQAYEKDSELLPEQHATNQTCVRQGIALAKERGFARAGQLLDLLNSRSKNEVLLRELSDEMFQHVTPEEWFAHAFESGAAPTGEAAA